MPSSRSFGSVRLLLDERPAVREEGEGRARRARTGGGVSWRAPSVTWRGGALPSAGTSQIAWR